MLVRVAVVLAAACWLAGCGSSQAPRGASADTPQAAMRRWAAATTPAAACRQLSYGFRLFVADGSASRCPDRIARHGIVPDGGAVHIAGVHARHGQELVEASLGGGQPTTFYFLLQDGRYRLNSIGIDIGPNTPPPPG